MSHTRDIYVTMTKTTLRYEIPKYFPVENILSKPIVEVKNNSISITFISQEQGESHQVKSSYENPLIESERTGGSEKSSQLYQLS